MRLIDALCVTTLLTVWAIMQLPAYVAVALVLVTPTSKTPRPLLVPTLASPLSVNAPSHIAMILFLLTFLSEECPISLLLLILHVLRLQMW
jgi:hypothetical protein